ncbi:tetratricopeptide repeat protein [Flavobacterium sp.]|uniref:tetratricopeptide repeat protein n=1 Tax=Flavobacterium sp. TaxID=239 RepID=UPI003D6A8C52
MKTVDKYLFQALDNYPYSLEETIESLDYTLSYDDKNTMALCLYGRVQAEQLFKYEEAKAYFQQAISINIHAFEVYPFYIHTLLLNEDYEEAKKLIDFALTIKGINKAEILIRKSMLFESRQKFKKALKVLKETRLTVLNSEFNYIIDESEKRLKEKRGKETKGKNLDKKKKKKK